MYSVLEAAIPFRFIFFMFHAENHKCVIIYSCKDVKVIIVTN